MSRSKPNSASDKSVDEALAVLIASTLRKQRGYSLLEIAHNLEVARKKLGTIPAIAERIGLSAKMLRQFGYVAKLSKSAQEVFAQRRLDSVDAAAHLAGLPQKLQGPLAEQLAAGKLNTKDLRAMVELLKREPAAPLEAMLQKVQASKAKREFVLEFPLRGDMSAARIRSAVSRFVPPSEIVEIETLGALGRLIVSLNGMQALRLTAKRNGVPFKHVMNTVLEGESHHGSRN